MVGTQQAVAGAAGTRPADAPSRPGPRQRPSQASTSAFANFPSGSERRTSPRKSASRGYRPWSVSAGVLNTFPQCGRAPNACRRSSTAATTASTEGVSFTQVKVEGDSVDPSGLAEPERICAHGADLSDLQQGMDQVTDLAELLPRGAREIDGEEVLRLELVTAAGHELQPEVRESLVPRAGDSELRRRVLRGHAGDRVARTVGEPASPHLSPGWFVAGRTQAFLEPDARSGGRSPVGEHADAVCRSQDRTELGREDLVG